MTSTTPAAAAADNPNASVEAFLAAYCAETAPLQYAVLLTGRWGSGKTFFLTNFLKRHDIPHLYVSLYGVASAAEIEQLIFAKLHPILSSKAAKLGGLLLRGLVKGTLKIDLDGDGKDDGSLSIGLPETDLADFAKKVSGRVLVFDDLERVKMDIAEVFGFINAFVEHEDMKAILVAHDEEIDREDPDFKRIKEKLIGQTLRIKPSVRAAYPDLLQLIGDGWTRAFLDQQRETVLELFARSASDNLRVLKQALWDFERIARAFRASDKTHTNALVEILKTVLALSIAVRTGELNEGDLDDLASLPWGRVLAARKDHTPTPLEKVEARYSDLEFRAGHLYSDVFKSLLVDGYVADAAVQTSLDRNPPFVTAAAQPSWRRVWHGFELAEADFDAAMAAFERDLDALTFDEPGVVFHVFGALAQAGAIRWRDYTDTKAIRRGKAYIKELAAADRLQVGPNPPLRFTTDTGYDGLGYLHRESEVFQTLIKAYETAVHDVWRASLPARARDALALLQRDAIAFAEAITATRAGHAIYWNTPILNRIPAGAFAAALLASPPGGQRAVLSAIEDRAQRPGDDLREERPWLRELSDALETALPKEGPMTRYRLKLNIARCLAPYTPAKSPTKPRKRGRSASKTVARRWSP